MYPGNLVGLIFLGVALLWTTKLVYERQRHRKGDALRFKMTMIGWLLIALGAVGAILSLPLPVAILMLAVSLVIFLVALTRYRRSETRALAMVIAVAAERGIPLPQAIDAYAHDTGDESSVRARKLTELLEMGAELPVAISRSGISMPEDAQTAVEYGSVTGDLGPALRHVILQSDADNARLGPILEKFVYVFAVVAVGASILTFVMVKIIPVFGQMFLEFDLELPRITEFVIHVCEQLISRFLLAALLGVLFVSLFGAFFRSLIFGPTIQSQSATLLRLLSLTAQRSGSFLQTLGLLSMRHPRARMRQRLMNVMAAMNNGVSWCDGLQKSGLVKSGDVAVLKAAERVGNLPWALNEIADSRIRRMAYQSAAVLNVVFPVVLTLVGLAVGVVTVAMMMPLAQLIMDLS